MVAAAVDTGRAVLARLAPVAPALRADPDAVTERAWLLTAALVGALIEAGATPAWRPATSGSTASRPAPARATAPISSSPPLAFEEQVAPVDRLRAGAIALPARGAAGGRRRPQARRSARRIRC